MPTTTFRVFVSSTFEDFHAERAALAWLGLALRERDPEQCSSALELLEHTCGGVLPVRRWEALAGTDELLSRLRSAAQTLPSAWLHQVADGDPARRDARLALLAHA